ncbi:polysaccharide deacetylase family protein [Clostridium pasteurianum DSM 525 = ATCC 6013]|uniref:Polysaccharide deacetylase n=1 Tax=Clostridium pasteurianum DSM 525 = ATCC 6013 TaxID=1262449 RepID=A0A0H3J2W1_CLOPA|nr:polysaccharide deacetylase family protein [Clostridium pasteurianum]AJA46253.1 polysaccharide deacetylase family protein [Clostridium pasteurianum DSM 525 = ATCC 6013]AJA50241.1 polysaccharide deacetylase family protein [Clostridium pasteurianum DSM 525 = ATCC 6013]AOZ73707.1 xylanase deacetylase [Clostridium pasteurianum DSM 525 = ATCC 6013]AOZ77504.1 xylanase deacetylase [Clostridium pasteurianum]ELP60837.1 polysaccharide deacetylase family protein [Clostridium pasteurianum DSM 525 = ATCC
MKSEEKKIIGASFFILLVVIIWAVIVNVNKDNSASKANASIASNSNSTVDKQNLKSDNQTDKQVPMKSNDKGVPILMYHSVSNDIAPAGLSGLRVTKDNFDAQMKYLKDNGYYTLTMDEVSNFITKNKPIPEKSVALTFDDGYKDNYTNVYPVLKQYGFKATVFVIAGNIDKNADYLTTVQLKEMQNNGIDIESGTYENLRLGNLTAAEQLESLQNSKQVLESILNKKVNYVSYPFGSYNTNTLNAVNKAGYLLGLSRDGRWSYKTDGIYKLSRVYIGPKHTEDNFKERINNSNYQ